MHGDTEDLMQETMVNDHSNERTGGEQWVHLVECSFTDSCLDVGGEMVVKNAMVFPEEHLGQFVAFERAEEQQSQEGGIHAGSDAETGDQRKYSAVIPLSGEFLDSSQQFVDGDLFGQDCPVQRSLGWKMLEDQCFADAGGSGDLFGRCSAEAFGREEGGRRRNQTGLTLLTRRSWLSCHRIQT